MECLLRARQFTYLILTGRPGRRSLGAAPFLKMWKLIEVTCGASGVMAATRKTGVSTRCLCPLPRLHGPVPPSVLRSPLAGRSPLTVACAVTWPCGNLCSGARDPQPGRVWGAPPSVLVTKAGRARGHQPFAPGVLAVAASQQESHVRSAL